jgi:hypothetical protein
MVGARAPWNGPDRNLVLEHQSLREPLYTQCLLFP